MLCVENLVNIEKKKIIYIFIFEDKDFEYIGVSFFRFRKRQIGEGGCEWLR